MNLHDRYLLNMLKQAAAILTPEAEQAAMQPPMPQQGAPMDPSMIGGAPMDPAMAGGMPPQGGMPMDPNMQGGMSQLPPEIMQDQMFLQFLSEMAGIMFDPNSGSFVDQEGNPVPPELIMQAYQAFQEQQAQMQGGAPMDPSMMGGMPPQGGMPMDPAMAGGMPPQGSPTEPAMMDPAMAGGMPPQGMPMDPAMVQGGAPMDPAMMGGMPMDPSMMGGAPMDPSMTGMPPEQGESGSDPMINEIASVVMSGVEAVLQEYTAGLEKKISALLDKIETLNNTVDSLQSTTDHRNEKQKTEEQDLRDELAAELMPVAEQPVPPPQAMDMGAPVQKAASARTKINLFNVIQGGCR